MQKLIISLACLMLSCSLASAEETPAPQFDHTNPVLLNELALQKVKDGDVSSALILLERAHLLAPHEVRIERNLQTLRAWRQGGRIDSAKEVNAPLDTGQNPAKNLEAPSISDYPLWSKK